MDEKKTHVSLLYTGLLAAVAFMICGMSKNSIFSNGIPLTDSSVFQYIGYCMWKYGELPYLNFFDHKGPLIYFINVLGTFVSLRYGIFIIEIFFMIVTLYFTWKALTLFSDRFCAMLASAMCFLFLYDFFECGNLVEEYSMAFIAASLYLFTDYYKNDRTDCVKIAVTGGCFAAVLLLRPNMIGLWIVFCCAVILRQIRKKEYFDILRMLVSFSAGTAAVLMPALLYLVKNGIWEDFWDCYIVFNFAYSDSGEGTLLYSLWSYLRTGFLMTTAALWGLAVFFRKREGWMMEHFAASAVAMGVSMLLCCLPGNPVPHYLMTVFPVAAVGYAYGIAWVVKHAGKAGMGAILFILAFQLWAMKDTYRKYQNEEDQMVCQMAEMIQEHSDPEDKITVYGNACKYYLASDRRSISRYIYQYPVGDVRPAIMDQYFRDLRTDRPVMIVIDHTFDMTEENRRKMEHLLSEGYEILYEDSQAAVWIYRDIGESA